MAAHGAGGLSGEVRVLVPQRRVKTHYSQLGVGAPAPRRRTFCATRITQRFDVRQTSINWQALGSFLRHHVTDCLDLAPLCLVHCIGQLAFYALRQDVVGLLCGWHDDTPLRRANVCRSVATPEMQSDQQSSGHCTLQLAYSATLFAASIPLRDLAAYTKRKKQFHSLAVLRLCWCRKPRSTSILMQGCSPAKPVYHAYFTVAATWTK